MRQITPLIELNNLRFLDHLWGVDVVVLEDTVFVIEVLRPPPICKEHISRENIPSELQSLEQLMIPREVSFERFKYSSANSVISAFQALHTNLNLRTRYSGSSENMRRVISSGRKSKFLPCSNSIIAFGVSDREHSCSVQYLLFLFFENICSFLFRHKINMYYILVYIER